MCMTTSMSFVPEVYYCPYPLLIALARHFKVLLPEVFGLCAVAWVAIAQYLLQDQRTRWNHMPNKIVTQELYIAAFDDAKANLTLEVFRCSFVLVHYTLCIQSISDTWWKLHYLFSLDPLATNKFDLSDPPLYIPAFAFEAIFIITSTPIHIPPLCTSGVRSLITGCRHSKLH